jgi:hypothetical protein
VCVVFDTQLGSAEKMARSLQQFGLPVRKNCRERWVSGR